MKAKVPGLAGDWEVGDRIKANIGDISKEELMCNRLEVMSEKIYMVHWIYAITQQILSHSQVPGTILSSKDIVTRKTDKSQFLTNLQSSGPHQQASLPAMGCARKHDCALGATHLSRTVREDLAGPVTLGCRLNEEELGLQISLKRMF